MLRTMNKSDDADNTDYSTHQRTYSCTGREKKKKKEKMERDP